MLTNEQNVRMMNGMKGEHVVRNEWMNEWMQIGDEWIIYNIPSLVVDLRLSIALVAASQKLKYKITLITMLIINIYLSIQMLTTLQYILNQSFILFHCILIYQIILFYYTV